MDFLLRKFVSELVQMSFKKLFKPLNFGKYVIMLDITKKRFFNQIYVMETCNLQRSRHNSLIID